MATNGKFVAYYRVSTKRQGRSGLGLEAQKQAVRDYLNGGRWSLVAEVQEEETGTNKRKRPKLAQALSSCRVYNATLIIAKLDRLARNVAFIANLMESGVKFVAVDLPEANEATIHIFSALAQHEAKLIAARTKAALQVARDKGVKLGGNPGNLDAKAARTGHKHSLEVRRDRAQKRASDLMPVIDDIKANGKITLRQIADELNTRGIPTARGGQWSAVQVQRVLTILHSSGRA